MKSVLKTIAILVSATGLQACGADAVNLEPNATLRFEFPELPDTLATLVTTQKQPAQITAQLPENYSRARTFPLFLFLDGWHGGRGDKLPIARGVTGPRDFICVNLPLFKRIYDHKDNMIVTPEDFEIVSRAYRPMLQRLLDAVPNITSERSAWGGYSNGAHTTAVLLAAQDEFVLRHFRAFYLVEGGFDRLATNVLNQTAMKGCRILIVRGDQPPDRTAKAVAGHEAFAQLGRQIESSAKEYHLDLTSVIMRGYGHEWPPKCSELIGHWIRGEQLPEIEKEPTKPAETARTPNKGAGPNERERDHAQ